MINRLQIRAARQLLEWDQSTLSDESGIGIATIKNIETGSSQPKVDTLNIIIQTFNDHGIEFIPGGARKTQELIRVLEGEEGFETFLDDVYLTAVKNGTSAKPCEVFLSNVVHENWIKWMGSEKWKHHTDRMTRRQDVMDVRIIVKEGDNNFPAIAYSKYKWMPVNRFREKSFYSYHDKLAFLDFRKNNVIITIIQQKDFAEGYRNHFLDTWDFAAIDPPEKEGDS